MEELVIVLLKLLVQLVLYAFTGKWHRFGESDDPSVPPAAGQPRSKPARARKAIAGALADLRDPAAAREALRKALADRLRGTPAEAQAPWLFEFADEYVEAEPSSELEGGEVNASQPIFQRPPKRRPQPVLGRAAGRRSIASAVRDRQCLTKAVLLGAALAPRTPRR
jgi:hypothetical protein